MSGKNSKVTDPLTDYEERTAATEIEKLRLADEQFRTAMRKAIERGQERAR
jgi:hypothetical protein